MATKIRSIKSFDNYEEYLEFIKNPENIIIEYCKHIYPFAFSIFANDYVPTTCTKCRTPHPDFDFNFPPVELDAT